MGTDIFSISGNIALDGIITSKMKGVHVNKTTVELKLKSGQVILLDAYDYQRIKKYNWFWNGHYAWRDCHCLGKRNLHKIYLHRLIMSANFEERVDHINRNPLDCRRVNLRICNMSQNAWNRAADKNSKSGYKGVYPGYKGQWTAYIGYRGERIYLGTFQTKEAAALAYDKKAKQLYKEFAWLNLQNGTN